MVLVHLLVALRLPHVAREVVLVEEGGPVVLVEKVTSDRLQQFPLLVALPLALRHVVDHLYALFVFSAVVDPMCWVMIPVKISASPAAISASRACP